VNFRITAQKDTKMANTTIEPTTAIVPDEDIQHGIDNNQFGDAEKGAKLGGVGGAVAGGVAGSMAGPVGTVVGAVLGAVAGAVGSGAAVAAVDRHDNDDKVSGVGQGIDIRKNPQAPIIVED